ncbi:hypothetical protein WOLCODRAFT_159395 [Wolfiporia cocos MD-104 SS10]|uniref:Uncharacterized protein n=1 Tax=Wolfiporia cocos (strain MD-104) TaxID=742152 RepID=A0A2H3JR67_WOLCO|nr:hypothetical protein WOLCODRAFT_159395 [Wolfiporia cocos MD-104 SS10]
MIIKLGYFLVRIYMFLIKNIHLGYSLARLYLSSRKDEYITQRHRAFLRSRSYTVHASGTVGDFHNADVKYPHTRHTPWDAARTTTAVLFQALGNVRCGLDKDGQGTMEDEIMISQGFCLHDLLPDPKKIPTAFPDKRITRRPPVPPPNNVAISSQSAPDEDTTLIEGASGGHQTFSKRKRNITDDGDSARADTKRVGRNV